MNNRELENKIASSFEDIAPDILDSVLQDCEEQKGRVFIMQEKKKKRSLAKTAAGIAAAFVLVFGGIMGMNAYSGSRAIASTVLLDVNPSIEIQVNKHEKVLAVKALNEDAKEVIGTMDFAGSSLEITVNALIGSMLRNGYISDAANSILVTVDSNDPTSGAELQSRLMAEIQTLMESSNHSVALLGQTMTPDEETARLAEEYGITAGKAKLITQIVAQTPAYAFADLVPMSINELNLLSESQNIPLQDVETVGKASDASYIGADAAKKAALDHAGVAAEDVSSIRCELDWEKGIMVYDVEFTVNGFEYDYEINATTGVVIKHQKEADDDYVAPQSKAPTSPESTPFADAPATPAAPTASDPAPAPEPLPASESTPAPSYIGEAAAKEKAFSHAGVSADSIAEYECSLDDENGLMVYEISFYSGGFEYDYDINAATGVVVKHQKEADDDYYTAPQNLTPALEHAPTPAPEPTPAPAPAASYIGEAAAKEKALSHAGVSADSITEYECSLDDENGIMVYEISFNSGGFEYDYEINAFTGAVVKHQKEAD